MSGLPAKSPLRDTQKRPVTAGFQFRQQMGELVKVLGKCEPHYIRCIKPNMQARACDSEPIAARAPRARRGPRLLYCGYLTNGF